MSDFNRLPSRSALLDFKRRQVEDGLLFPLSATSIGEDKVWQARVRRLNTTDRAAIEMLPTAMQETVMAGLKAFQKLQKETKDPDTLMDVAKQNDEMMTTANAFCLAGFIEPRLVATEAELSANTDAYLVTDIAAEDRLSWFFACADADHAAARSLKSFRPESSPDVPARETGRLDAFPTVGSAGVAG